MREYLLVLLVSTGVPSPVTYVCFLVGVTLAAYLTWGRRARPAHG